MGFSLCSATSETAEKITPITMKMAIRFITIIPANVPRKDPQNVFNLKCVLGENNDASINLFSQGYRMKE